MQKTFQEHKILHIILITICLWVAYGFSLSNGFVWDDYMNIVDNTMIRDFKNVSKLFTREYLTHPNDLVYLGQKDVGFGEISYRPVATFTYLVDYALWQLKPLGYHLTNITIHWFNALIIYFIILSLGFLPVAALVGAILFSVHPLNTEAVMVASFREDLLAMFFVLIAFRLLILWRKKDDFVGKDIILLGSSLAYLLALFSKEMAITWIIFSVLYLAFDYQHELKKKWKLILKVFLANATALCLYLYIWLGPMARYKSGEAGYPLGSLWINVLTMIKVVGHYLWWIIWPLNIAPTIPDERLFVASVFNIPFLFSLMAIITLIFIGIKHRRKNWLITFGLCWFFIALAPVLNIIPIENIMAARYLYLPFAGVSLITAFLCQKIRMKQWFSFITKDFWSALVMVSFGFFMCVTISKGFNYQNEINFRKSFLEKYAHKAKTYLAIGSAYQRISKYEKANQFLLKAREMDPSIAALSMDIGLNFIRLGELDKAKLALEEGIKKNPSYFPVRNIYCSLFGQHGLHQQAIQCFEELVQQFPQEVEGFYNLGVSYNFVGKQDEALYAWRRGLEIQADHAGLKNLIVTNQP